MRAGCRVSHEHHENFLPRPLGRCARPFLLVLLRLSRPLCLWGAGGRLLRRPGGARAIVHLCRSRPLGWLGWWRVGRRRLVGKPRLVGPSVLRALHHSGEPPSSQQQCGARQLARHDQLPRRACVRRCGARHTALFLAADAFPPVHDAQHALVQQPLFRARTLGADVGTAAIFAQFLPQLALAAQQLQCATRLPATQQLVTLILLLRRQIAPEPLGFVLPQFRQ